MPESTGHLFYLATAEALLEYHERGGAVWTANCIAPIGADGSRGGSFAGWSDNLDELLLSLGLLDYAPDVDVGDLERDDGIAWCDDFIGHRGQPYHPCPMFASAQEPRGSTQTPDPVEDTREAEKAPPCPIPVREAVPLPSVWDAPDGSFRLDERGETFRLCWLTPGGKESKSRKAGKRAFDVRPEFVQLFIDNWRSASKLQWSIMPLDWLWGHADKRGGVFEGTIPPRMLRQLLRQLPEEIEGLYRLDLHGFDLKRGKERVTLRIAQ